MEALKILFASSEVEPFVKTGGLADVAGSLPRALRGNGLDVRVVMPKYAQIPAQYTEQMTYLGQVEVDLVWRKQYCGVYHLVEKGVECYFLDNEYYFHRDWYYGQVDDGERFAFFSRAILAFLPFVDFKPDILHLNDWQTGMTPVFLDAHFRWSRNNGFFRSMRTVFTIHNLRYQGVFPKELMDSVLGLDWSWFYPGGVAHNDCVNFMKGALNQSTRITTVSRTYAEEIKSAYFGEGLEGTIAHRGTDLRGIVNGIDYEHNNPETDTRLYATFHAGDLSGKAVNKASLQRQHHLPVREDVPLVGIISRMVDQKGFDLVAHVLEDLLQEDIQIMVLGTGEPKYEELFRWAHHAYPQKLSAHIKYDGTLAQRMYAGCDMFLMPSLFEPCGLSQIFSMRYGTVPVVRETGGLKDTVIPYNPLTAEGTGFTFANYNAHEMLEALRRGMMVFRDAKQWETLVKRCMAEDFSWNHAAREYEALYREMMDVYPDVNPVPTAVVAEKPVLERETSNPVPRKKAVQPKRRSVQGEADASPTKGKPVLTTVKKSPGRKKNVLPVETPSPVKGKAASAKSTATPAREKAASTAIKTAPVKEKTAKANAVPSAGNSDSAVKKASPVRRTGSSGVKGVAVRNRKKDAADELDRDLALALETDPATLLEE